MPRQNQTPDGNRTAELWVRAAIPMGADDRQKRLFDRARKTFDEVSARLVPNQLSLSGIAVETSAGIELRNAIVDARRWATVEDVNLDPYLPIADESSMVEDRSRRVLTFPSVALVEYEADAIIAVTPHVDGDDVVSVEARLDELVEREERSVVVAES